MFTWKSVRAAALLPAALLVLAAVLTGCAPGGEQPPENSGGGTADNNSGAFAESDLGFDFNETLTPILAAFEGFGLDFFNADFEEMVIDAENCHIIQAAKNFVPYVYSKDGELAVMNAADLQTFMKEAFGVDLPPATIGMYEYNGADGTFSWPESDGGLNCEVFRPVEFIPNANGSITARTDLYVFDISQYGSELLNTNIPKPEGEWDTRIAWGKAASPEVTFRLNEDGKFFPMRLISVKSVINGWERAQGVYESPDSGFAIALRAEERYTREYASVVATAAESGEEHELGGFINASCALLSEPSFESAAFATLNEDGTLTISGIPESGLGQSLSGVYVKTSAELPPERLKLDYDTYNVTGIELEDAPGEPNYIGHYFWPYITGLGDAEFEAYVSGFIGDAVRAPAAEFEREYNEFRAEIAAEADAELKANLEQVASMYEYASELYPLTTSESYCAVVETRYQFLGGAHPTSYVKVFNIDTSGKKMLTLKDVFNDSGYRDVIEGKLNEMAQTEEYSELLYSDGENVTLTNEEDFYFAKDNLVIFYQQYDIAPYSSGFIVFNIPVSDLKYILKEEYAQADFRDEMEQEKLFGNSFSKAGSF